MTTPQRARTARTRRAGALATLAGAASLAFAAVAGPVTAQEGPPDDRGHGNNRGTIKINDVDLTGKANVPHVDCIFDVAFFGFHDGAIADITFSMHRPTTTPIDPGTSPDTTHSRTGVELGEAVHPPSEVQHVETFDLTAFVAPFERHQRQGHHIKVRAEVRDTRGGPKQKVFWVDCPGVPDEPNGENGPPENGPPENGPPENGPPENGPPENGPPENGVTLPVTEEEVAGVIVEQQPEAPAEAPAPAQPAPEQPAVEQPAAEVRGVQEARTQLPRTGNEATLALVALGLMMAGAGALLYTPTTAGRSTG